MISPRPGPASRVHAAGRRATPPRGTIIRVFMWAIPFLLARLEPLLDPVPGDAQHVLDVLESSLGQVVVAHQTPFELPAVSDLLDDEAYLLKGRPRVIVVPELLDAGDVERTGEAPLSAGLVVVALPVVLPVPGRLVLQEGVGPFQDAQIVDRDGLVAALEPEQLKASGKERQK